MIYNEYQLPNPFKAKEYLELLSDSIESYIDSIIAGSPLINANSQRFLGMSISELQQLKAGTLSELELWGCFAVLSSIEGHIRQDSFRRVKGFEKNQQLTIAYQQIFRKTGRSNKKFANVHLEDLLTEIKNHELVDETNVRKLKGALKIRLWIAHGRYYAPKSPYNNTGKPFIQVERINEDALDFASDFGITKEGIT
jgi:hypothetical protein